MRKEIISEIKAEVDKFFEGVDEERLENFEELLSDGVTSHGMYLGEVKEMWLDDEDEEKGKLEELMEDDRFGDMIAWRAVCYDWEYVTLSVLGG